LLSALLSGVFIWRASVRWKAVVSGQSEKLTAAMRAALLDIISKALPRRAFHLKRSF